MSAFADEIEQQIVPDLQKAIVAADVRGDFGPHLKVQERLRNIADRLRAAEAL